MPLFGMQDTWWQKIPRNGHIGICKKEEEEKRLGQKIIGDRHEDIQTDRPLISEIDNSLNTTQYISHY